MCGSIRSIYLYGNFCVVVGSLSKGMEEHVRALIDAGLIQLMLTIVTNGNADKYLVEISLCVIRSIYEHSFAPSEIIHSNSTTLVHMIGECNIHIIIAIYLCYRCCRLIIMLIKFIVLINY